MFSRKIRRPAIFDFCNTIPGEADSDALAESLRGQLRKRDAEVAALPRRLDEIMNRLDKIEAAPRSGLRAVAREHTRSRGSPFALAASQI